MSKEKTFKIEGMTCASCSQIIEDNGKKLHGVDSIEVSFATEKCYLKVKDSFNFESFSELLTSLGYRAIDPSEQNSANENRLKPILLHSIISLLTGSFFMLITMGPVSTFFSHSATNLIQLILTSLVLIFFGKSYFISLGHFFKTGLANMNTLIGIGLAAAFIYSVVLMAINEHAHVYFEAIPFVIGFTQLGHFLEEKAKTKARSSLSSLYKMQIKFALKVENGIDVNTPVVDLKIGDKIKLKPGDKIPLDAKVILGISHCDESMLTGESQAVAKKVGDKVFAGSLNLDGTIIVEVDKMLHQTFISSVVSYVEKAQLQKAPIQKYADKIIKYFVPSIIAIAALTLVIWLLFYSGIEGNDRSYQAFSHMIAVLLIACPCALGLAVPMAVMLSTAEASRHGLLMGGGAVIEKANSINTIVFDKTGTLTEGMPEVVDTSFIAEEAVFLQLAGSLSQYSNHPLSRSITSYVAHKNISLLDPETFKNIAGLGIEGSVANKKILIGSADLLLQNNITFESSTKIGSHVYVAVDGIYKGVFVISDPLKNSALETIQSLQDSGYELWLLTGDNELVANETAKTLGINNIKSNIKPVGKADFIQELKSKGKIVAMIGDGINDAPALATSDLSIAMSSGSDVAIEASEVSLLEGKILNLVYFFDLSKETMKIIKQNLILSFSYNILCIPLAAGVFYPVFHISLTPMWASAAMGMSSLSVILSSLRLKKSL